MRTYNRNKSTSKSVDAVNALFAHNIIKRKAQTVKKIIKITELPKRSSTPKVLDESTFLRVRPEDTFDRLLKGDNFNSVRYKSIVKADNSSPEKTPLIENDSDKLRSESSIPSVQIESIRHSPIISVQNDVSSQNATPIDCSLEVEVVNKRKRRKSLNFAYDKNTGTLFKPLLSNSLLLNNKMVSSTPNVRKIVADKLTNESIISPIRSKNAETVLEESMKEIETWSLVPPDFSSSSNIVNSDRIASKNKRSDGKLKMKAQVNLSKLNIRMALADRDRWTDDSTKMPRIYRCKSVNADDFESFVSSKILDIQSSLGTAEDDSAIPKIETRRLTRSMGRKIVITNDDLDLCLKKNRKNKSKDGDLSGNNSKSKSKSSFNLTNERVSNNYESLVNGKIFTSDSIEDDPELVSMNLDNRTRRNFIMTRSRSRSRCSLDETNAAPNRTAKSLDKTKPNKTGLINRARARSLSRHSVINTKKSNTNEMSDYDNSKSSYRINSIKSRRKSCSLNNTNRLKSIIKKKNRSRSVSSFDEMVTTHTISDDDLSEIVDLTDEDYVCPVDEMGRSRPNKTNSKNVSSFSQEHDYACSLNTCENIILNDTSAIGRSGKNKLRNYSQSNLIDSCIRVNRKRKCRALSLSAENSSSNDQIHTINDSTNIFSSYANENQLISFKNESIILNDSCNLFDKSSRITIDDLSNSKIYTNPSLTSSTPMRRIKIDYDELMEHNFSKSIHNDGGFNRSKSAITMRNRFEDMKECTVNIYSDEALRSLDRSEMCNLENIVEESDKFDKFVMPPLPRRSIFGFGKKFRRSLSLMRRTSNMSFSMRDESPKCKNRILDVAGNCRKSIRFVPDPQQANKPSYRQSVIKTYAHFTNGYVPNSVQGTGALENRIGDFSVNVHNSRQSLKGPQAFLTAREIVLIRCGQTVPVPFSECYPNTILKNCQKIGEGVYGEVFLFRNGKGSTTVMKVIPIEGDLIVNGERQKKFEEILSEVVIAMELSSLRNDKKNSTSGFNEVTSINCVKGKYPERLLELWELYDENKGTENDCPDVFTGEQLYIVLELANGGKDLESYVFNNALQAHALFMQTACSLAVAEVALQFEHRDLHWGNILISNTDKSTTLTYNINGRQLEVPSEGVQVSIIDFTLSRIRYDGICIFNDLGQDPDLFTGEGDYQCEIYRLMQKCNGNNWQHFVPCTNILWLHYTLDKMISALRYKYPRTKTHKTFIKKMIDLKEQILEYKSVEEFVRNHM